MEENGVNSNNSGNNAEPAKEKPEHPSHTQVFNIVTGKDPSWREIIYELIASEQLDPWNIDIAVLCRSYFDKIKQLEVSKKRIDLKNSNVMESFPASKIEKIGL